MIIHKELTGATPEEFELAVKGILDAAAKTLVNYESAHLERLEGSDGDYVLDVVARFEALGAEFVVLVECKHQGRKVERHEVQVLHAKLQSLGAQKGMLFSTAGFQSGAIEYADAHGIALVRLADGESAWMTRSDGPAPPPPSWARLPPYIGWWYHGPRMSLMSSDFAEFTRQALGLDRPGA
ncbi:MAG: hypothetical protein BGP24_07620 [Lysobacterales bacterium 69-70]|nr:restriction endonuclease [Xanthomonadaceae bacterium]OJY93636.1 MAG: hypothetical protein BGP24_07620 [Xanthomonadales bacterium 69-70]